MGRILGRKYQLYFIVHVLLIATRGQADLRLNISQQNGTIDELRLRILHCDPSLPLLLLTLRQGRRDTAGHTLIQLLCRADRASHRGGGTGHFLTRVLRLDLGDAHLLIDADDALELANLALFATLVLTTSHRLFANRNLVHLSIEVRVRAHSVARSHRLLTHLLQSSSAERLRCRLLDLRLNCFLLSLQDVAVLRLKSDVPRPEAFEVDRRQVHRAERLELVRFLRQYAAAAVKFRC